MKQQHETMATALATMAKQHTPDHKALAVAMFTSGATSKEVEKRTGIKASYVRTLARRVSQKSETLVSVVSETETRFLETGGTIVSTVFQDKSDVAVSDLKSKVGEPNWGPSNVMAPETVAKEKPDWVVTFGASVLFVIALGHAALIWYDCGILWGVPGLIAGGLVFLIILAALSLMGRPKAKEASENMLWFVWLLDGLAAFVHYPTFWHNATIGYQFGIREFETWAMSAVVCVCSGAAVYFYRQIVIK